MKKVANRDLFGKIKSHESPGGTYYSVSQSDYEQLKEHVHKLRYEIEQIIKADFAGQEAVQKLQELLKNEEQYIQAEAERMAIERFREMEEREALSYKREKETEKELAQAIETKNNMSAIAQKIADEAIHAIPQELQDEHNFVMEQLKKINPVAHYHVQMALYQRNQEIAQKVEERAKEHQQQHQHHHRHR